MPENKQEGTKPENVLVESVVIFGLIILIKYISKAVNGSKSVLPVAASVAIGYYVIMFIVSRVRPCMCTNIRNSITWAAGASLGGL